MKMPGQEVFRQGELGDRLYLVLSGEVDVVREEAGESRVLARLGPGPWFGEMALLHQSAHSPRRPRRWGRRESPLKPGRSLE